MWRKEKRVAPHLALLPVRLHAGLESHHINAEATLLRHQSREIIRKSIVGVKREDVGAGNDLLPLSPQLLHHPVETTKSLGQSSAETVFLRLYCLLSRDKAKGAIVSSVL